jgi:hypothetical protein
MEKGWKMGIAVEKTGSGDQLRLAGVELIFPCVFPKISNAGLHSLHQFLVFWEEGAARNF